MNEETTEKTREDTALNISKLEELIEEVKTKKLALFTNEDSDRNDVVEGIQYYNPMLSSLSKELHAEQGELTAL